MKIKICIFFLLISFGLVAWHVPGNTSAEKKSPPMGWNSWNWFGKEHINETIVREIIDAISEKGLADAGYKYVVIDGGWRDTALGPNGDLKPHPVKFPHGIKALADYAHSKGLKLGLHTVPGTHDCGGDKVGGWKHEEIQVQQFADWGVDFIKLDLCINKDEKWNEENIKQTYFKWHDLIARSSHDILLSLSAYASRDWYPEVGAIARTTPDISCLRYRGANFDKTRQGVMAIADLNNKAAAAAGGGYWNDPDILVVGEQGLTVEEQKVHFALWCIMTAPLMLGNDPRNMHEYEKDLLTNKECINIDQDPSEQGRKIFSENGFEVWRKKMSNGDNAILIINRSNVTGQDFLLTFDKIGLSNKQEIRDVFEHKNLGTFKESIPFKMALHSGWFLLCKS